MQNVNILRRILGLDKKKLDKITRDLIENYFRDEDVIWPDTADADKVEGLVCNLLEVIASLHNELYKVVTGSYYDYMFHWVNKVTGGYWDHLDDKYKEV